MEKIQVSRKDAAATAAFLAGIERLDPRGVLTRHDLEALARNGQCFQARAAGGHAVYVLVVDNGVAWIDAAKGTGATDWTAHLLPIIEAQAAGCKAVGFQTARRGLVKKARQQGYTVTGWILKKKLP